MKTILLPVLLGCVGVMLTSAQAQESATPARSKISVEQRFKQWDKNGDGKLTADEVSGEELFKMLDKDGDEKLDRNELSTALFDRLDADQDGFVTEEEAKALSKPRR